jgi:1-acyl-sn-glycerol-3-phosphate acyltransferase
MGTFRGAAVLTGFFGFTVPLMPLQAIFLKVSDRAARKFPNWYHRNVCRIMGITLKIEGEVARNAPVLLVCNHTSWLDIPVLSALAPVSFIAKEEVRGWPFVSALARLQRSVFVDRTRRLAAGKAVNEIAERLATGDVIVLFAEGTSSAGNSVLPFKSSLFGGVLGAGTDAFRGALVQTAAVVYTHRHGIPVTRADRPRIGWYGDMEMKSHACDVLKSGPITVTIKVGRPVPFEEFKDRKDMALTTERQIRRDVVAILRGRPNDLHLTAVEPGIDVRRQSRAEPKGRSGKWT